MCSAAGLHQQKMGELIKALGFGDESGVKKLRELCEGCPACMLAAIRQSKLQQEEIPCDDGYGSYNFHVEFDYQQAKKEFWADVNDANYMASFSSEYIY